MNSYLAARCVRCHRLFGSGRAIIKLSKKEPCVVHGLSVFFVLLRASKNLASCQKKKLEENSGPDPLIQASSIDAVMGPDKLIYHQVSSIGPATRQSIDNQHA